MTLGIVDGIPDLRHPVLQGASIDVLETMIPPGATEPDAHGTSICSLIFGRGDSVSGLAPGCSGLVLPLFFRKANEAELRPVSQLDLARAISFGLERSVSIINISAGQKSVTTETESHLEQVIHQSVERRVLLVAAAGNDGCACIHLPAGVEFVLSVGALGSAGQPLATSNWAEAYRRNGLLAPGENLPVAIPGGGVGTSSGTSFAAAVVSGVAALLLSVALREGYQLDPLDIRQILIESATPCELEGDGACDRYLAGTLDAAAALASVHRAGQSRRSIATPLAADRRSFTVAHSGNRQFADFGTGELVMSDLSSVGAVAVEPAGLSASGPSASGLSPSACSCQQKPDEETKAKIDQHSIANESSPSPPAPVAQSAPSAGGLMQQACSCGGGEPPQIVFALGALWFDFGTEARYDALVQQLGDPVRANNPTELIAFMRQNPQFMAGITFILMQEQIPLYAIQPAGPFALQVYAAMLDALESSLDETRNKEQRVSIPGMIAGSTRLMNGMTVPVVFPDLRGMYKWQSHELIAAAKAAVGRRSASMMTKS